MTNLRIRTQLFLAFGFFVVTLFGTLIILNSHLGHMKDYINKLYNHPFTVVRAAYELQNNVMEVHEQLFFVMNTEDTKIKSKIKEEIKRHQQLVFQSLVVIKDRFLGEQSQIKELEAQLNLWNEVIDKKIENGGVCFTATESEILYRLIEDFITFAEGKADSFLKGSEENSIHLLKITLVVTLILIFLSIILAVVTIRYIDKPLQEVLATIRKVTKKDLSARCVVNQANFEMKSLSNALNETIEDLQKVQEIASLGSWKWDTETNVLEWSSEVFRIFEEDPLTFSPTYSEFVERIHPSDRKRVAKEVSHCIATNSPYEIEHKIICRDGTVKVVLERGGVFLKEGEPRQMIGTVQDITSQYKQRILIETITEIQEDFISLEDSKISFDRILSNIVELTKSKFGFISKVVFQDNKYKLQALAISDISWDEESTTLYKEYWEGGDIYFENMEIIPGQVALSGEPFISDNAMEDERRKGTLPKGHPSIEQLLVLPLKKDGNVLGCIGLANRKEGYTVEMIEYLRPLLETCTTLIDSYNAQIVIKESQKELVKTSHLASLGRMVAGVAHEINTPIGITVTLSSHMRSRIQELSELFKDGTLTKSKFLDDMDTLLESIDLLSDNVQKAQDLVKSFKLVSSESYDQELMTFDLKLYVNSVLLNLKHKTKRYNVTIQVEMEDNLEIYSTPPVYSQIFTNLILNSLMHAYDKEDNGTILIKVELEDDLKITYSDDGKGIKEEVLSKIFEPFFTTNRIKGGTGLGLHIISNIVTEKLGGFISCDSTVGEGTTFEIRVPRKNISV